MLVISRKIGEGAMIGPDIRVVIVDIKRGRGAVRVGIIAPESVKILRDELCESVWGTLPIGSEKDVQ